MTLGNEVFLEMGDATLVLHQNHCVVIKGVRKTVESFLDIVNFFFHIAKSPDNVPV